jgi:hypothetical protein
MTKKVVGVFVRFFVRRFNSSTSAQQHSEEQHSL